MILGLRHIRRRKKKSLEHFVVHLHIWAPKSLVRLSTLDQQLMFGQQEFFIIPFFLVNNLSLVDQSQNFSAKLLIATLNSQRAIIQLFGLSTSFQQELRTRTLKSSCILFQSNQLKTIHLVRPFFTLKHQRILWRNFLIQMKNNELLLNKFYINTKTGSKINNEKG